MRAACLFNSELMDFIRPHVREGVKTETIDRLVHEYTLDHGHIPACLGYPGDKYPFPKSCCISVNEVICHGIPGQNRLKSGDIVNLDLTTIVDGWHGDQSETFIIGRASELARRVTQCAFECLYAAIDAIETGSPISNIGDAIVRHATTYYPGFGIVDKYIGHGIGQKFHQPPNIPHVPNRASRSERLYAGMCFTIEPMINGGTFRTVSDPTDGWTVRTADGQVSAQFEHTIMMGDDGPEVLTFTKNGPLPGHDFLNSDD